MPILVSTTLFPANPENKLTDGKYVQDAIIVVEDIIERGLLPAGFLKEGIRILMNSDGLFYKYTGGNWNPDNSFISAINGLTKVGNDIKLGGTLTEPTIINGGGNSLAKIFQFSTIETAIISENSGGLSVVAQNTVSPKNVVFTVQGANGFNVSHREQVSNDTIEIKCDINLLNSIFLGIYKNGTTGKGIYFDKTDNRFKATSTNLTPTLTELITYENLTNYVNNIVASSVVLKGNYNATTTPNSSALNGYMYVVTVAGNGGGFWTTNSLEIGDSIIAKVDNPTTESDWIVVNKDLDAQSIKASYESNADTNAFTDAEQEKLAGLNNVTASNGLNRSVNDIKLGGALTENTTIDIPDNTSFNIVGSNIGSSISNYAQVFEVRADFIYFIPKNSIGLHRIKANQIDFRNQNDVVLLNLQDTSIFVSTPRFFLHSVTTTDFSSVSFSIGALAYNSDVERLVYANGVNGAKYVANTDDLAELTNQKFTQSLLSANWIFDSGTTYYQDVAHNLGTEDIGIEIYDLTTKETVIVQSVVRTTINNVRVYVNGNTDNLKIAIWDLTFGTAPRRKVVKNPSSPYTVKNGDIVIWDCTSGNKILNLPASINSIDFVFDVKKIDASSNTITIDPNSSELIEGSLNTVLTTQYQRLSATCDGTEWWILASV